ncbi:MAG: hypothetical protein D4R97_03255 [Bacteroidetes bacterium]|nr:MAG: hypothetical protein D4R97_03255 [Bacteroidota bacterium]
MTAHISKGISEPSEKINPGIPAVGGNNDNTPITIPNTAVVLLKTGLRSITILVISRAMPSMTYPTSNAVPRRFCKGFSSQSQLFRIQKVVLLFP